MCERKRESERARGNWVWEGGIDLDVEAEGKEGVCFDVDLKASRARCVSQVVSERDACVAERHAKTVGQGLYRGGYGGGVSRSGGV